MGKINFLDPHDQPIKVEENVEALTLNIIMKKEKSKVSIYILTPVSGKFPKFFTCTLFLNKMKEIYGLQKIVP